MYINIYIYKLVSYSYDLMMCIYTYCCCHFVDASYPFMNCPRCSMCCFGMFRPFMAFPNTNCIQPSSLFHPFSTPSVLWHQEHLHPNAMQHQHGHCHDGTADQEGGQNDQSSWTPLWKEGRQLVHGPKPGGNSMLDDLDLLRP